MKLTKIKNLDGSKLTMSELETISQYIVAKLAKAGFITEAAPLNSQAIKIGLHMRSFSVNVQKLGYNAVIGSYVRTKSGYKRTNIPVWSQRVEFNVIVNNCLNKFKVSCNIKSGPFTIRDGTKCYYEQDWVNQLPEWQRGYNTDAGVNGMGQVVCLRVTEAEALESTNIHDYLSTL